MTKKYNASSKNATLKSEKLPALQFYPGDWKKDLGVQALNYEERGIYFELLLMMHDADDRGKLSINGVAIDHKTLAKLLQIHPQTLLKALRNLLEKGVVSREDDTGILYNRRMVRDEEFRQKRIEWGYLGAEHGIKGGRPKGSKNNPLDGFEKNPPSSSSSSSSSDLITKVIRSTNPHEKSHADLKEGDPGEKTFEAPANLPASATFSPAAPNKSKKKNPTLFDLKTSITREQYQSILSNPSLGGSNRAFLRFCVEQMADWSTSSGKSKLDWSAALRNWIRKTRQDGMTPENFESRINGKKSEAPKTFFELEEERHKNALASFLAKGETNDKLN